MWFSIATSNNNHIDAYMCIVWHGWWHTDFIFGRFGGSVCVTYGCTMCVCVCMYVYTYIYIWMQRVCIYMYIYTVFITMYNIEIQCWMTGWSKCFFVYIGNHQIYSWQLFDLPNFGKPMMKRGILVVHSTYCRPKNMVLSL